MFGLTISSIRSLFRLALELILYVLFSSQSCLVPYPLLSLSVEVAVSSFSWFVPVTSRSAVAAALFSCFVHVDMSKDTHGENAQFLCKWNNVPILMYSFSVDIALLHAPAGHMCSILSLALVSVLLFAAIPCHSGIPGRSAPAPYKCSTFRSLLVLWRSAHDVHH